MNGLQISLMQCCLTGGKLFKGMTEDEYLSHMRKEDKFLSVVTVVIYYGEKAWDGAKDLHGVLNIPDEIKPFVGNYPMHLVEVVNNTLQFKNADNRDLFQLLNLVYNASLDKKQRLEKTQEYEDSHTVDEDVVRALAATNHIKIEKTSRKERLKVCTLFEEIARDSRVEANVASAKRMLSGGKLSVEEIAEYTNLSVEIVLELQNQEELSQG